MVENEGWIQGHLHNESPTRVGMRASEEVETNRWRVDDSVGSRGSRRRQRDRGNREKGGKYKGEPRKWEIHPVNGQNS